MDAFDTRRSSELSEPTSVYSGFETTSNETSTEKLLRRLASDDAFREQMLGDPVSTLKSYGLEIDPAQVPAIRRLPSKEALREHHQSLSGQLSSKAALWIFVR